MKIKLSPAQQKVVEIILDKGGTILYEELQVPRLVYFEGLPIRIETVTFQALRTRGILVSCAKGQYKLDKNALKKMDGEWGWRGRANT